MPDRKSIYQNKAEVYERLISREDYQQNIQRALGGICAFRNKDILEMGAGTGRLTRMLAPFARSIIATDLSSAMLDTFQRKMEKESIQNWKTIVADMRSVPVADKSADVLIAGWAVCSIALHEPQWQDEVLKVLKEMQRIIRDNGTIIIIETLGIGQTHPQPASERFAQYFRLLEAQGFSSETIRTDYQFASQQEMQELLTFFFDEEMLVKGAPLSGVIYPECTGIWWKSV